MKERALVLLSSGLDSTVNLFAAVRELDVCLALTFDYGQRAAPQEIGYSKILAEALGVAHRVIQLPWFKELGHSSLTRLDHKIPRGDQVQIDDHEQSLKSAKAVWVPNRNGVFLNIAASFAESLGIRWVIPGFNAEEAQTFPDNSGAYMESLNRAFSYSTNPTVGVKCYTVDMSKKEIVALGRSLEVPFHHLWPCYFAGSTPCGQCESCLRFERALG